MKRTRTLTVLALALSLSLPLVTITEAKASECSEPSEAPSSQQPTLLTIIDTEIGTEAFERLVTYSNGGHRSLGIAIAQAHEWFGVCEYVGVGIGSGSGGNGYRPNFMLALWRDGIDTDLARSAVYQLVGASSNPVVTNGDCAISCDGTIGGVAPTTTTTTLAPTTTTTVAVSETAEPMTMSEPVAESEPVATEPATTTTTTIPVVASAGVSISLAPVKVAPKKPVATKKQPKKPVAKKSPPKKRTVRR